MTAHLVTLTDLLATGDHPHDASPHILGTAVALVRLAHVQRDGVVLSRLRESTARWRASPATAWFAPVVDCLDALWGEKLECERAVAAADRAFEEFCRQSMKSKEFGVSTAQQELGEWKMAAYRGLVILKVIALDHALRAWPDRPKSAGSSKLLEAYRETLAWATASETLKGSLSTSFRQPQILCNELSRLQALKPR
jgi:hypothetical protein